MLWCDNWDTFQRGAQILYEVLRDFGAELNKTKSEWMEICGASAQLDRAPLPGGKILWLGGDGIPKTGVFKYLGSLVAINATLGVAQDVSRRVALAHGAFGQLRHVWPSSLSRSVKAGIFLACVGSTLL